MLFFRHTLILLRLMLMSPCRARCSLLLRRHDMLSAVKAIDADTDYCYFRRDAAADFRLRH